MEKISERMTIQEQIIYSAEFMFEREITDIAGGNISVRDGDDIYMTPTLAGNQYHWHIDPVDIVIGEMSQIEELKLHPRFTREGLSHLAIYKAFPFVSAVIHAHPKYILPFTAFSKPIPPILNASKQFGELQYHAEAPAYSQEQADAIVNVLKGKEGLMKEKAAGVLMPRHGLIAAGGDLMTVLDCVQRMNTNAFSVLAQKWIE
jgi:L-fuculose-phosphate aldolase